MTLTNMPGSVYIEAGLSAYTDDELYKELERRGTDRISILFKDFEDALARIVSRYEANQQAANKIDKQAQA